MVKTMNEIKMELLDREFPSREPNAAEMQRFAVINEGAKAFAAVVIENVPWSSDRDHAVQTIREAAMRAKDALLVYTPARMIESGSLS